MQAFGRYAVWETEKTTTAELVMATDMGIASFKIVTSANGKKVQVFSGFDLASWAPGVAYTAGHELHKHRYWEAQEKAVSKWRGHFQPLGIDSCHGHLQNIEACVEMELSQAIQSDVKVRSHWRMLTDLEEGRPSARAPNVGQSAPHAPKAASIPKVDRQAELMATDEGYGIF